MSRPHPPEKQFTRKEGYSLKKIRIHPDVVIAAVGLVLSLIMFIESLGYPADVARFPKIFLCLFAICMVIILIKGIRLSIAKTKDDSAVDESEWWCKLENTKYPLIVIGFVIVYVLLIRLAGFYIASFVYSIVTMRFFGVKKWKTNILVPAVLLALIYLVFELLLKLKLPGGLLFTGRW